MNKPKPTSVRLLPESIEWLREYGRNHQRGQTGVVTDAVELYKAIAEHAAYITDKDTPLTQEELLAVVLDGVKELRRRKHRQSMVGKAAPPKERVESLDEVSEDP